MAQSEFTCRWGYIALVAFQCSCNKSRLKVMFFFIQSSTYQFFFSAQRILDSVQDQVTPGPQTLKVRLAFAFTDKVIRPAVCGQQFSSRKHAPEIFYHPELGHGS